MGRVGGKKLINFVADIATGADISRRQLSIDALSKWPDASVADKLLEIANKATDPAERNQAFLENPRRAGNKIWGKERVEAVFREENNCKDPRWR